jgi:BirA family biotin operon repressor/biotin-[acetyl-CoA-carboxylase] ligase
MRRDARVDELERTIADPQWRAALHVEVIGRSIRHVRSTGSTNDDLKILATTGAAEGLVLSTDQQTAGRGRRGRSWEAPPGTSLLVSALLRPWWLPPGDSFYLTMLAAVACAEAIEEAVGLHVDLKWPNDLQIAGLKLGGILIESEIGDGTLRWTIAGMGINVNWDPSSVPELAGAATSLASMTGAPVERAALLQRLLNHLDARYLRLRTGARTELLADWRRRLTTLGRTVRAEHAGTIIEGVAEDVTGSGALIVRDLDGIQHRLTSGEVTVRLRPD